MYDGIEHKYIQWYEWTSKQNLPYMALNVNGIAKDFSKKIVDFIIACSFFPFLLHEMGDVREKVIALTEKVLPEGVKFSDKVHSGTADGASVNNVLIQILKPLESVPLRELMVSL